jgi:hypothetical protein
MIVSLGTHRESVDTIDGVDLLLECHARIRRMLEIGRRLASAVAPASEDAIAAAQ